MYTNSAINKIKLMIAAAEKHIPVIAFPLFTLDLSPNPLKIKPKNIKINP